MRPAPCPSPASPAGITGKCADRLRGVARLCDGAMAAEFALVIPVLLLLVFAIIDFGRVMWVRSSLQSAVEDAARCYALALPDVCDTPDGVKAHAAQVAMGLQVASSIFTPTDETCGKRVQANYPFTSIVPMIPLSLTVSVSACRPVATPP